MGQAAQIGSRSLSLSLLLNKRSHSHNLIYVRSFYSLRVWKLYWKSFVNCKRSLLFSLQVPCNWSQGIEKDVVTKLQRRPNWQCWKLGTSLQVLIPMMVPRDFIGVSVRNDLQLFTQNQNGKIKVLTFNCQIQALTGKDNIVKLSLDFS